MYLLFSITTYPLSPLLSEEQAQSIITIKYGNDAHLQSRRNENYTFLYFWDILDFDFFHWELKVLTSAKSLVYMMTGWVVGLQW